MTDNRLMAAKHGRFVPGQATPVYFAPPPGETERPWDSPGAPPWADPRPPRKTSGWVIVGIVAAVLTVLLCGAFSMVAFSGGQGEPGPGFTTMPARDEVPAAPSADQAAEVSHAIGKTFRSGDFQYTIHGVKTGLAQVGGEFSREKAQGAFTRLDVTVKNVSKKAVYFDTDLRVKVEDAKGRQFSSATSANLVGNVSADGWFTEVNPGNSIRAFAYFDLPKGTTATRAVISAGMLTFEADAVVPLG